jgi:hypothetical protein
MSIQRDEAITRIKAALKRRSTKTWSVTGGTGTARSWITVQAPPRRCDQDGCTSPEDSAELGLLFGQPGPVHRQGLQISLGEREYCVLAVEGAKAA